MNWTDKRVDVLARVPPALLESQKSVIAWYTLANPSKLPFTMVTRGSVVPWWHAKDRDCSRCHEPPQRAVSAPACSRIARATATARNVANNSIGGLHLGRVAPSRAVHDLNDALG